MPLLDRASCADGAFVGSRHARGDEHAENIIAGLSRVLEKRLKRELRRLARRREVVDHLIDARIEVVEIHRGVFVLDAAMPHEQRHHLDIAILGNFGGNRRHRVRDDPDQNPYLPADAAEPRHELAPPLV